MMLKRHWLGTLGIVVLGMMVSLHPWPAPAAEATTQPVKTTNSIGMTFVLIQSGEFVMGSPADELGRDADETPHPVRITKPFYLMTTEVTQAQWKAITGENPSDHVGDDLPVHNLAWNTITGYMRRLSAIEGKTYRLPTEAEWEYACRAGNAPPTAVELGGVAWHRGNSARQPHPVGTKKPNAWGLFDMHGNAWEWTADFYGDYLTQIEDPVQTRQTKGNVRVLRGGSWSDDARILRPANRNSNAPGLIGANFGFRLAFSAE